MHDDRPDGHRSTEAQSRDMNSGTSRPDDAERLRQFKADFFKALGHPLRIRILELLRSGPMSVTQIQEATDVPASSVSQQLAVLRGRNVLTTERHGTTIIYSVADAELFEMLDVARRLFYIHLSDKADLLRLVEDEAVRAAER
jgi:DNA-binding transcriptional ArsR family regulator